MRRSRACCAIGLLATVGAAAAPLAAAPAPPSAVAPYPFGIEVKVSERALRTFFTFEVSGAMFPPPDPGARIRVGEQARAAYASAARRMFRTGEAAAELELEKVVADVAFDDDGWNAVVEHALVLRARGGAEIARWEVRGRELIVGLGPRAMPRAFERAADQAARRFEVAFEEPAGMSAWLRDRGAEPGRPRVLAAERATGPSAAGTPRLVSPPRGTGFYAEPGFGLYFLSSRLENGTLQQGAVTVRGGVSGPWAFVQASLSRTTVHSVNRPAVEIRAWGMEAGPLLRIGSRAELAVGGGLHSIGPQYSGAAASIFGAARTVMPVSRNGTRLRLGLEVREDMGKTVWTEAGRLVPAFSAWLLLGLELPLPEPPLNPVNPVNPDP